MLVETPDTRRKLAHVEPLTDLGHPGTHADSLVASAGPDREGEAPGLPGWLDDPLRPLTCPAEPRPDGPREAQMGNAVTVGVAEWIGQRLLAYDESLNPVRF